MPSRPSHATSVPHIRCLCNGCAGLNPAAYRAVVEALRKVESAYREAMAVNQPALVREVQAALAASQEETSHA